MTTLDKIRSDIWARTRNRIRDQTKHPVRNQVQDETRNLENQVLVLIQDTFLFARLAEEITPRRRYQPLS